jgi:DNA-binding NarL/FixJ family response regulator
MIADDFGMMRDVIGRVLKLAGDIEVVAMAPHLVDALAEAERTQPHVIILDDYLPPADAAYAAERFRQAGVKAALLVTSMGIEPGDVDRALAKGANGAMKREEFVSHLIPAVRQLREDHYYLSPLAEAAMIGAPAG